MNRYIAALAAAAACAALAAGAAEPIAIGTLFKVPQHRDLRISPDGKHIAAISGKDGRQNLIVIDIDSRKATAVTTFSRIDVLSSFWINNRRLGFITGTLATADFEQRGGVLMAVDIDGSNMRDLTEISAAGGKEMGREHHFTLLVRRLPGDTDDIIARDFPRGRYQESPRPGELVRIDTRTARRTPIGVGKPDSAQNESWVVDARGVGRVMVANGEGRTRIWYRAGPDAEWQKLDEGPEDSIAWRPLALGKDDRTLLVASRQGRDKDAIVTYDPAKRTFGEVLAQHPQVDLASLERNRDGEVVGVAYFADRDGAAWFDAELAGVQKAVDKAFPDTVNDLSWCDDRSRFVVYTYSDVSPGSYYLLDRKTGKMEWLVDRAPWIDPKQMAHMQPVRYAARDGLEIPAYLTLPRGSDGKNLPMVVVVHGGPWVHGETWRFDPEAQFLASRGYAVLQPNFRGSTGYGWKHFQSSFRQWGLAMQDDLSDGVAWAVKEGIADAKRVCIYGGSYGGYATMMGLAKDPDLYRCGIDYVGVTDLNLLLTATWSDTAYTDWIGYQVKERLGDVSKDAERLRATSPVNLAARIKAPVLMAYGSEDVRVVPEHGTRMRDALEKAGQKPQWILAEGEGHGFRDPKNQEMFYGAMEKFLAENLKPERPAAAAAR